VSGGSPATPLRVGFVAVIRPLFKGDSPEAAGRALEQLSELGEELGFELLTQALPEQVPHVATGRPLPPFAVHDEVSARRAAEQFDQLDLDLLLVQQTTFATGEVLAPLLRLNLPAAVWAIPEAAGGRGATGPLPLNSLCGLNMTMSLLDGGPVDRKLPVKWLYGEAGSPQFRQRLAPTLIALRALRGLREARVLQIGGTAPHFYRLEEQPRLVGVRVEHLELEQLFERIAAVPEAEASEVVARWREKETTALTTAQLERSAALELALSRLVAEGSYSALALRCWPELPERCDTMACAALARLGDASIPAACEGDVMGALSMVVLQAAGDSPALLMDLSDVNEQHGLFFWHCGNGPLAWAGPAGTRLTTHFNRAGVGTVRDMAMRPGPATGFRLLDGGQSAVVFAGEVSARRDGSDYDGVRGWLGSLTWNGVPLSPRQFLANLLDRRLPHHFALGAGGLDEGLQELCGWLGAEILPLQDERNTL
jgi:L-fucose isomerase-like protein